MILKKKYYFILLVIIPFFLINTFCKEDIPVNYICWLKNVNVRLAPGLDSKIIASLNEGEEVIYLNEKSDFTTKIRLRGTEYDTSWVKIKKKDGTTGWVYGGTLKIKKDLPEPEEEKKKEPEV